VRSNQSEHIYDMHLFFFGQPADMLLVFYEDIDFLKNLLIGFIVFIQK